MPEVGSGPVGAGANAVEFSVSELSGAIKRALEDGFGYVRLRGEISGYRGPHASGHCYFALKDDKAKIEAVIWRAGFQRLRFKPEEGMEVIAQGRVTTYPGSSKYQIVIEQLEPAGLGALMALLEERKRKLAAEGLFDEARKQKLPFLPRVVGIVTSPTGAVIRDMLHGFAERCPTRVLVWPVRVQGETSAAEVAAAIRGFNAIPEHGGPVPRPDVLIVARGGGSLEDLWGFNEEVVARAAAESRIPLISAVGHETDTTLIDYVADARAPTPTKAAEWAVPRHSDLVLQTGDLALRLRSANRRFLESCRAHFKAAVRGLPRLEDLLALPRQRFDAMDRRLGAALLANTRAHGLRHARASVRLTPRLIADRIERCRGQVDLLQRRGRDALHRCNTQRRSRLDRASVRLTPEIVRGRLERCHERLGVLGQRADRALGHVTLARRRALASVSQLLASVSYQSVLARGFALVRDGQGRAVRALAHTRPGQPIAIEFADGVAAARIEGTPAPTSAAGGTSTTASLKLKTAAAPKSGAAQKIGSDGSQGSLF